MKIAALLPTLLPDLARGAIDSLAVAMRPFGQAEIVVVSPAPIEGPRVKWVEEREARGVTRAQNAALAATDADIVLAVSDDIRARPDSIERAVRFLLENEPTIAPYIVGFNFIHPGTYPHGIIGTVYGHYYPYFPLVRRRTIEAVGWYDIAYHSFWCDADMALRTWAAPGGRCEMSSGCFDLLSGRAGAVEVPGKSENFWRDMAVFQARWADTLGRGWGRELKDFNIDLRPHEPLPQGLPREAVAALQAELQDAMRSGRMPAPENAPELGRPKTVG
jgi:hypothetical protein